MIGQYLTTHDVTPQQLIVEITETSLMVNHKLAMQTLTRLAEMGVRSSIDDFGTGYSSLAYLKMLPASELKIDRSFVMDMLDSENDAVIVRTIIDLAHNLGLKVTGEGVESLKSTLLELVNTGALRNNETIVTNTRHYDALLKALEEIDKVQQGLDNNLSGDLLAVDIRQALYYFGEITGEITNDELLGNIFANFCIGK